MSYGRLESGCNYQYKLDRGTEAKCMCGNFRESGYSGEYVGAFERLVEQSDKNLNAH